jgi:lipoprotein-releasing system ATP-binding protein
MALIDIRGLKKSYDSESEHLVILENLDFKMESGDIIALTGESGSGKSTLLNLISGLDEITEGEVYTCGYPVHTLKEDELAAFRRQDLGLVFQFHFLLKELTALENVYLAAWMAGMSRQESIDLARQWIMKVGLEDRIGHYPGQLSGGERQRISLARALMGRPKLILADEPTGNLDQENSLIVEDLLFSLVEESGCSLLLVTHDKRLAARSPKHFQVVNKRLERV